MKHSDLETLKKLNPNKSKKTVELIPGPKGERGFTGKQGEKGSPGKDGLQGHQGIQGKSGISGSRGEKGLQGSNGMMGARGFQGIPGNKGEIGKEGEKGRRGHQGPAGGFPNLIKRLDFNTELDNPDHKEGRLFYDKAKHALSYYNEESDITVNLAQEFLIRVKNNSGSAIPNGTAVYPSGVDLVTGDVTIGLADAISKRKSRLVGVVTHNIEDGSHGYVTRLGDVGGLDTSEYATGDLLYLSATIPGKLVSDYPAANTGAFNIVMGAIKKVHTTDGIIVVDINSDNTTMEVTNQNGFPEYQRETNTTMTFVDGTRTFSLIPVTPPLHFYVEGVKYEKETADSIVISDIEGLHAIYYDGDDLAIVVNPTDSDAADIIKTKALVTAIYWDATNKESLYFADERHGLSMAPETHAYLHFTRGAQFLSGMALGDILADENGNLDSHAQFSVSSGGIIDEDLYTNIFSVPATTGLPIHHLSGSNADLRRSYNSGFSVRTFDKTSTTRLAFNENIGGVWQLTEVASKNYVLCHVFAVNSYGTERVFAIMGQAEYLKTSDARAGANTEIGNLLIILPFAEMVPIGSIIFKTDLGYANAVNAAIISTLSGSDYVDWRTSQLSQGSAPTNHGNLTGLGDDDHPQYSLVDGTRDFTGVVAGVAPTADLHLATKKYIDDLVAAHITAYH